jgi:hypothetical protein
MTALAVPACGVAAPEHDIRSPFLAAQPPSATRQAVAERDGVGLLSIHDAAEKVRRP